MTLMSPPILVAASTAVAFSSAINGSTLSAMADGT